MVHSRPMVTRDCWEGGRGDGEVNVSGYGVDFRSVLKLHDGDVPQLREYTKTNELHTLGLNFS